MAVDLDAEELEIQARLRAQLPELRLVESGEDLDADDLPRRAANVPAAFTALTAEKSEGRKIHNSKFQIIEQQWEVLVVAGSDRSANEAHRGPSGAKELIRRVKQALVGWKPSQAATSFVFEETRNVGRLGNRILYAVAFRATVHDSFTA